MQRHVALAAVAAAAAAGTGHAGAGLRARGLNFDFDDAYAAAVAAAAPAPGLARRAHGYTPSTAQRDERAHTHCDAQCHGKKVKAVTYTDCMHDCMKVARKTM